MLYLIVLLFPICSTIDWIHFIKTNACWLHEYEKKYTHVWLEMEAWVANARRKKLKSDFFEVFDFLDFSDAFEFFVICLSYGFWPFLLLICSMFECFNISVKLSLFFTYYNVIEPRGKIAKIRCFWFSWLFFDFLQPKFSDFQLKKIKNIRKIQKI